MAESASQLGRLLIIFGVVSIAVGAVFVLGDRVSWLRLGRLPGDFTWGRGSVRIYFPIATSLLISLILTLIFWLLRR